ncbi:MAG: UDP binding domain-containing protein, partial [Bryobacteraceae bacterium]
GFAFGGSCLPKDLRALIYRAGRLDVSLPMLESAIPSNEEHLARDQRMVMELPAKQLGIIGLAFKEDTDDLRESPVVSMLEYLIGKGRDVKVFDPHIRLEGIYGTNRKFLLESIPHIGRLMTTSIEDVLGWAEHLVIAQKQKSAVMAKIEASGLPWVDLVSRLSGAGASPGTALLATNLAGY